MKLTIEIRAKQLKFQEIYQTLCALLPTIRKHEGCRECHIYKDTEEEGVFFLTFDWKEGSGLENYLQSNNGSAFLGAIDVLSETSRVRIGDEESWGGIEILKRMRKEK
jgi:quinol monooxygenase YgiN